MLELGAGAGANFACYPAGVTVIATEPDEYMLARARKRLSKLPSVDVALKRADAQELPFADASFDTVIGTLVFCTIPDPMKALDEAKRVLKPGGKLLLMEHIRGPDSVRGVTEDIIAPVWKLMAGGCHVNRNTVDLVRKSGFNISSVKSHFVGLEIVEIVAFKSA